MIDVSLTSLTKRYPWRVSFTVSVVVVESALDTLYPLVIGLAINGLLEDSYSGLFWLSVLGISTAIVGSGRRFLDTRIYAGIYRDMAVLLAKGEQEENAPVTRISARVILFEEFIEFLEDSVPELVGTVVSVLLILTIMLTLNPQVFFGSFAFLCIFAAVYFFTGSRNFNLNRGFNNQLEQQVSAIEDGRSRRMFIHFGRMMQWRIRLSDLETINFFIIWIAAVALIVFTPISAVNSEIVKYGLVLSLLMYVFQFIDGVVELPTHIQQLIRLREISDRLAGRK